METTEITTSPEGTQGEGLQPERTYSKAELQEVIEARQAAKEEARKLAERIQAYETADAAKRQKELEAKGQYDSIIQEKETKLKTYESELEESRKILAGIKEDLLNQLPEEHKAIAEALSLEKLREYVKLNSKKETPGTETARAGGNTNVDYSKITDAKKLTLKELEEIRKVNPVKYNELLKIR